MHFPHIRIDVLRMKLIPFALKYSAKCWMYGLATNSVASWNDFVRLFLRKYFPNAKTIKLRNEINQFVQLDRESFWKYFDRFKNLLAQCPHHGLDQTRLCQIVYKGLNQQTRTIVESMCQGGFLSKSATGAWEFLEDLAEKTMQWESARDNSLKSRITRGGLHSISDVSHLESKIAILKKHVKGIVSPNVPDILDFYCVMFPLSGLRSFLKYLSLFCSSVSNWTRASEYGLPKTKERSIFPLL